MTLGFENETLEFKKSTGELKEAVVSICAILNKHGYGELYFGVKPDGLPVGQEISEKTLRDVSIAINNSIVPQIFPEVKKVVIAGKSCVYVKFEGHNPPYFANGKARIRVADQDVLMSPEQIEEYVMRKNDNANLWEQQVSDYTIEKVEDVLLKRYIDKAREIKRIDFEYSDIKTVLNKLFLTQGEFLLNAAKVLFCDSILAELQMAIFATNERLTFNDIQRKHGNIFELVDTAELYIRNNIKWKLILMVRGNGGKLRKYQLQH